MQNSRQYTFIQNYRHTKSSIKTTYGDTLEIDWKEVTGIVDDNKINLPKVVTIKLQDKIKVRHLMNRQPLLFHLMLKQGIMWYTLAAGIQEIV